MQVVTSYRSPVGLAILLLLPLSAPAEEFAEELVVQPSLDVGFIHYRFEQKGLFSLEGSELGTGLSPISFSDTMPFVGAGITLFHGRAFVDARVQKAFDGEDQDTLEQVGRGGIPTFTSNQIERDWDRTEYSFTVGYAATEQLAVFAGYRFSDTEFDEQNLLDRRDGTPPIPFTSKLDYEQDGPFLGANYSWAVGEAGFLSMNLALALIEGDITQSGPFPTGRFSGDTFGATAGISWTAPLPLFPALTYTVSVDGYQYEFDSDEALVADFSESVLRATVGISRPFGL